MALFVFMYALLLVSRRGSFGVILYTMTSRILVTSAIFLFIALNGEGYVPLGISQFNLFGPRHYLQMSNNVK